jgi:ATP-binding cassette subfamily C protein LapB
MNKEVERPEGKAFIRRPGFEGRIEAKQLGFTYPESEKTTLAGINIRIEPGEHVGIIGKVGSGKSSIAKLLVGLYQPTEGAILIDDLDISQVDPADLRQHIAYVSQEIALLRGSVRDNILFKDPHLEDESLLKAAQLGGVDLFINSHPLGYDMQVGEQGGNLSGGQRQCIGIARSLLLDTPIVILDEPTSNMDNTTESVVRKRLHEHTRGKTLILITHKAPMLDLVERLIVLDEGRVVLDGKKDKVLAALQGENKS